MVSLTGKDYLLISSAARTAKAVAACEVALMTENLA